MADELKTKLRMQWWLQDQKYPPEDIGALGLASAAIVMKTH